MHQIVVGTFDRQAAARAAVAALADARFDPRRVHAIQTSAPPCGDDEAAAPVVDHGVVDHLRNFLAGLLGIGHDVGAYAAAMRRAGAVVGVDVDDRPQAVRAELALTRAGAIEIHRRSGD
jgi:hypothetical protein